MAPGIRALVAGWMVLEFVVVLESRFIAMVVFAKENCWNIWREKAGSGLVIRGWKGYGDHEGEDSIYRQTALCEAVELPLRNTFLSRC